MKMITLMICSILSADVSLFVPTPLDVVVEMLKLAEVSQDDIVYDLGCGDGRIVIAASKFYKCRSVGIDIDEGCVEDAQDNVNLNKVGNLVRIYQGDILETDFQQATVVTLYLMPSLSAELLPALRKLKPGTRIVAHNKPIPGVKPTKIKRFFSMDGYEHKLYLWVTPFELVGRT